MTTISSIESGIRSFVYKLDYAIAEQHYYVQAERSGARPNIGRTLSEILNSPLETLHYDIRSLNERVQILRTFGFVDERLKTLWDNFYTSTLIRQPQGIQIHFKKLHSHFPVQEQIGIFRKTDLVLLEDDDPESIPNGIKRTELEKAKTLYRVIVRKFSPNKNAFPDPKALKQFQKRIRRDLLMILSRPKGRQLISQIAAKRYSFETEVMEAEAFEIFHYKSKDLLALNFSKRGESNYQDIPYIGRGSISTPSFILFAHELIHALQYIGEEDHIPDPHLPDYWTDARELRTIQGICQCHDPHPISENTIRAEHGLFTRYSHCKGSGKNTSPKKKFIKAAEVGAIVDLLAALPEVSRNVVESGLEKLRENSYLSEFEEVLKVAREKGILRETREPPTKKQCIQASPSAQP